MASDEQFAGVWDILAEEGHVDARLGAEYRRVYQEWVDAGRPVEILAFIREHL